METKNMNYNYNGEYAHEGVVCKKCDVPLSATSITTDNKAFICRVLYCNKCKTLMDKSWWSTPKMMAQFEIAKEQMIKAANLPPEPATGRKKTCSVCHEPGHNRRTCPHGGG
tara:strand:+ start:1726 stop:2061 length:336 start_codon:yes stop_codon:yes gene_type:complete